jgi:hypothetical protein
LHAATGETRNGQTENILPASIFVSQLVQFDPPAKWFDLPVGPARDSFLEMWSDAIRQWTKVAIVGDPWTVEYDSNRDYYFDPTVTDIPSNSPLAVVRWTAFPNRVQYYLEQTYGARFTADEILEFADNGELADGTSLPRIPTVVCPQLDVQSALQPFGPTGPRGWQDEYCEWCVERDQSTGKILRVAFTCENPDYWYTLWNIDPKVVLHFYRELVSSDVQLADLFLRDSNGNIVSDPQTARPAYDPINKWNQKTSYQPDRGGVVHLTSQPNTLNAEIYVAASACVLRQRDYDPQALVCCSPYGDSFRHSDPHIMFQINRLIKESNVRVSLANPIGLYIQDPDFSNYALPNVPGAKGKQASDFWTVRRGYAQGVNPDLPHDLGFALHTVYEVPAGLGFCVGDILIAGQPINWASQIARTFKVALAAQAIPSVSPLPNPLPCQTPMSMPRPHPIALMDYGMLKAGSSTALAPRIAQGSTRDGLALVCIGGDSTASIDVTGSGVSWTLQGFLANQPVTLPGQEANLNASIYLLSMTVDAQATLGPRDVSVTDNGDPAGIPSPSLFTIVEAGTTP